MIAQMFPGMEWMILVIGGMILLLIVGAITGIILFLKGTVSLTLRKTKVQYRVAQMLIGSMLLIPPFFCLFGEGWALPASNAPLREKIITGMTEAEVRSVLGIPGSRNTYEDGSGYWFYKCDWWGFDYFMISFDSDGKVKYTGLAG